MAKITLKLLNQSDQGWEYEITIKDESSSSSHKVMLTNDYYKKLTVNEKVKPYELVEKSIEFLLERENKESILSEFDLKIINNYFPEYEDEIKVRL